jgi:hypothetical protein
MRHIGPPLSCPCCSCCRPWRRCPLRCRACCSAAPTAQHWVARRRPLRTTWHRTTWRWRRPRQSSRCARGPACCRRQCLTLVQHPPLLLLCACVHAPLLNKYCPVPTTYCHLSTAAPSDCHLMPHIASHAAPLPAGWPGGHLQCSRRCGTGAAQRRHSSPGPPHRCLRRQAGQDRQRAAVPLRAQPPGPPQPHTWQRAQAQVLRCDALALPAAAACCRCVTAHHCMPAWLSLCWARKGPLIMSITCTCTSR